MSIENVMKKARKLREVMRRERGVELRELIKRGSMSRERIYNVSKELKKILQMDK